MEANMLTCVIVPVRSKPVLRLCPSDVISAPFCAGCAGQSDLRVRVVPDGSDPYPE
jgi:hypothetical protein